MSGFITIICARCERPARLSWSLCVRTVRISHPEAVAGLGDLQSVCSTCVSELIRQRAAERSDASS
jgi:hypothetical protein